MITPAGKECKYFYGDYYRGRQREECRLLIASGDPSGWKPDLCFSCPVPDILRANACEHMELHARIHRPFPFIKRQVRIKAYCSKCECEVAEPQVGCGQCHTLPDIFTGVLDDTDPAG